MFQAGKMGLGPTHPGAALPFFCHNGDPLSQPPPAHMGIPPYQLDGKAGAMGEFNADWRRIGPLLAATGTYPPNIPPMVVVCGSLLVMGLPTMISDRPKFKFGGGARFFLKPPHFRVIKFLFTGHGVCTYLTIS